MPSDLQFILLHRRTFDRSEHDTIRVRLGVVPRLLRAIIGALAIGIVGLAFLPVSVAIPITVAGAALTYWWTGRPLVVLDGNERVLRVYSPWIPFPQLATHRIPLDALDRFHTIERRDEESQTASSIELLVGPRLVIRHEVYTRVKGQAVVVADFGTKAEAEELVAVMNRELGVRVQ